MSMEITNAYGGYATGDYASAIQKSTAAKSDSAANSVDAYYEKLCKKFPQISINVINLDKVTNVGDIMMGNENKIVVNLSRNCLKKMADDPTFAKEIENKISGTPEGLKWLYATARSDGKKILGTATIINADGSACSTSKIKTISSDTNKSANIVNMKNGTKDKLDKVRKKNLEKHREEAERIEKAQKEKKEKEDYMDRLLDKYSSAVNTYDATGYEIEDATSTINRQA